MELLIALVLSVLFAFVLRKSIKQYAIAYYIVAVAVDVLFLSRVLFDVSRGFAVLTSPYIMRCLVGFGLFSVVMFIGIFSEKSKVRRMLMPIRGELSIIAAILVVGHVVNYLESYLAQILAGFAGMSVGMTLSFVVSSLLIVLLAVLTVTSFNAVKKKHEPQQVESCTKNGLCFFRFNISAPCSCSAPDNFFDRAKSCFKHRCLFDYYASVRDAESTKSMD